MTTFCSMEAEKKRLIRLIAHQPIFKSRETRKIRAYGAVARIADGTHTHTGNAHNATFSPSFVIVYLKRTGHENEANVRTHTAI